MSYIHRDSLAECILLQQKPYLLLLFCCRLLFAHACNIFLPKETFYTDQEGRVCTLNTADNPGSGYTHEVTRPQSQSNYLLHNMHTHTHLCP